MIVKLKKIKELDNAEVPNNIAEGHVKILRVGKVDPPKVGEPFVLANIGNWYRTSIVTEIIDEKTFKTLNSIYEWEMIDNENS